MDRPLLAAFCAAQLLGMTNYAGVAANLPEFIAVWNLSHAQAGWISGIFFAGYTAVVPFLVSLTDRVDPRRVYLASTAITVVSTLAFALIADGFWTALVCRALGGVGLAGTYMPGLKALTDRAADDQRARISGIYTATYSAAASVSFVFIGVFDVLFGWRWAFGLSGMGAALAFVLVAWVLPPTPPKPAPPSSLWNVLDFRPELRNVPALGFMLGYLAVVWVISANRAWMVAFLEQAIALQPAGATVIGAVTCAAVLNLIGPLASVTGNELAIRHGAVRVIAFFFVISAVGAVVFGLLLDAPYLVLLAVGLIYTAVIGANGSSVTAGTVQVAVPARRGATMALHSCLGFLGGFLGPLVFGYVLDGAGGGMDAWGYAFASSAAICLAGAAVVAWLARDFRQA